MPGDVVGHAETEAAHNLLQMAGCCVPRLPRVVVQKRQRHGKEPACHAWGSNRGMPRHKRQVQVAEWEPAMPAWRGGSGVHARKQQVEGTEEGPAMLAWRGGSGVHARVQHAHGAEKESATLTWHGSTGVHTHTRHAHDEGQEEKAVPASGSGGSSTTCCASEVCRPVLIPAVTATGPRLNIQALERQQQQQQHCALCTPHNEVRRVVCMAVCLGLVAWLLCWLCMANELCLWRRLQCPSPPQIRFRVRNCLLVVTTCIDQIFSPNMAPRVNPSPPPSPWTPTHI